MRLGNGPCASSIPDDVLRQDPIQSGHSCQESGADAVFTSTPTALTPFDGCVERSRQRPLIDVMLIPSYPDGI